MHYLDSSASIGYQVTETQGFFQAIFSLLIENSTIQGFQLYLPKQTIRHFKVQTYYAGLNDKFQ